jgi:hypothetical protein
LRSSVEWALMLALATTFAGALRQGPPSFRTTEADFAVRLPS